MKITFTPINPPAPVRPADMPEGVAFDYVLGPLKCVCVAMVHKGDIYSVDKNEQPMHPLRKLEGSDFYEVLRRRDSQPLPNAQPEPVPLDTLEPFPVWYRDAYGDGYVCHDGADAYARWAGCFSVVDACSASGAAAYNTPYIMEVQP